MRPHDVNSCPHLELIDLAAGKSIKGLAPLFWGTEGFAFETPGRHVVEVIILWNIAGVPVAASGSQAIFVGYPTSKTDNDMAALLLDPEVGRAIATRRAWVFERAAERIKQATKQGGSHPAAKAMAKLAVLSPPTRTSKPTGTPKRAGATKRDSPRKSRKK